MPEDRWDLHKAGLSNANLKSAILQDVNLSKAILIAADLSEADISGACLDHANTSGWKIEGIICTHIVDKDGNGTRFKPGEFERRYTQIERMYPLFLKVLSQILLII